jgi:hypothetical protein
MDFGAWAEVFLDGRWYPIDARHNHPRVGRIVMGRAFPAACTFVQPSLPIVAVSMMPPSE